MLNVLMQIKEFFVSIAMLIFNLLRGIFYMLRMIPNALTMLNYSVGFMPTVLVSFALALISVSVVYMIIGR